MSKAVDCSALEIRMPAEAVTAARTIIVSSRGEFDVYVGWPLPQALDPRIAAGSIYARQFERRAWSPTCALVEFEGRWRHRLAGLTRRRWLDALHSLRGKRLGCCCADPGGTRCHATVLARLVEEFCA